MKPAAALAAIALLAGCASGPQLAGTAVPDERTAQVMPGKTTKAGLVSLLGKTDAVVFDSGYEAWLYEIPAGGGKYAEFVVLIGPDGVVRKTRRRAPALPGQ